MSGELAKREMETGDKPATSHGSTSLEESRNKRKEKKLLQQRKGEEILFPQVGSERRQTQEDEESGLLRDRLFITIDLRLRRTVRYFQAPRAQEV
jgi:hypothetical protein